MKKIYATLMALAAAFLLVPTAFAQSDETYISQKGVGYNKYLKNTEPNEDGEYILRLETFLTGSVSKTAIPTDFVLTLDCSGSMIYDCLYGASRPEKVTAAQMQDSNSPYYEFLRPAHKAGNITAGLNHYTYGHGYSAGTLDKKCREPVMVIVFGGTSITRVPIRARRYTIIMSRIKPTTKSSVINRGIIAGFISRVLAERKDM